MLLFLVTRIRGLHGHKTEYSTHFCLFIYHWEGIKCDSSVGSSEIYCDYVLKHGKSLLIEQRYSQSLLPLSQFTCLHSCDL